MGRAGRERGQVIEQEFVYGEEMATEPIEAGILQASGETVTLWTASRAQSLAWKPLWLVTDRLPQGKDSYDAVLLAEGTPPFSAAVLERTFTVAKQSLPMAGWRGMEHPGRGV